MAPTWKDFLLAIPVGMIAYTGIETISNMAEEAKDEAKTIPAAINRVVIAVFAIYALLPPVALSALPVTQRRTATTRPCSASPRTRAASPATRCSAWSSTSTWAPCSGAAEIYVGLLAATILFIATNAGIIGVSRLVYSMGIHRQVPDRLRQLHPQLPHAVDRDHRSSAAIACLADDPRQGRVPGQHVRVRGDAVVHDRARLGHPAAPASTRTSSGPDRGRATSASRGSRLPLFAVFGGLGTFWPSSSVTLLHVDVALAGIGWLALGCVIYPIYRHRQGLDLTSTMKVAIPTPVVDHEAEYESILVAFDERELPPTARSRPRSRSRPAGGAASTCS